MISRIPSVVSTLFLLREGLVVYIQMKNRFCVDMKALFTFTTSCFNIHCAILNEAFEQ